MKLDNIYMDFEHFRLILTKEDKAKLDREFRFLDRLTKFLTKKIKDKFNITGGEKKIAPSSLRPLVYGIIKRFKESKRYDFSSYSYLDHFDYASFKMFQRFELKKDKEEVKLTNYPFYNSNSVIRFGRENFKMGWQNVEFINCKIKGKIRPKNKNFRNFRYLYVEKRNDEYYLFGQTYKEKNLDAKDEVEASIIISDFSSVKVYDSNNNFTTYNLELNKENYNVDRLVKIAIYHKQCLKHNGGFKSNNVLRLERKSDDCYEKIRRKIRQKYTRIIIDIVKKYEYISIQKPANHNYFLNNNQKTIIEKHLINEFYKSLNHYAEKFNAKVVYVDLGYDIGKICHECGALTYDDSSNILHCDCGATIDKNLNAGINLLSYLVNKCGLKNRYFFKKENVKQLELF